MHIQSQRTKVVMVGLLLSATYGVPAAAQEPERMAEVATESPKAENWLHIYRDASPMIGPTDRGPYDEYLDVDYLEVQGKWTLVHTKTVRDDAATEYHGKLTRITLAISCKEFRFGYPHVVDFADADGRIPMHESTLSLAEVDELAFGRAPAPSSPGAIYYRFACLGVRPRPEEIGVTLP
jgi:hypothetical protein